MLILKSLAEVQVLKCLVEMCITYTNQKDKTDILEIKELRTKVFTRKLHMQTVSYGQQYFYAVYFL